ncbi:MAG: flavodoxin domain-containing protein [Spirochaetes bacterium]|nr:flavodoxin domain-containing protein [Spirochaetota bacterium]
MKILIAYLSQTGNTEKIARAIHREASKDHDAVLHSMGVEPSIDASGYDVIFVGSPCHAGALSAGAKNFLESIKEGTTSRLAGFITHASSAYQRDDYIHSMLFFEHFCKKNGIPYAGCYECRGFLAPALHDMVKKSKKISDAEWKTIVEEMTGHPDAEDEEAAQDFARSVLA